MYIILTILKIVLLLLSPFLISGTIWFVYFRFFKHLKPTGIKVKIKNESKLKRLIIDFPKRFVKDSLTCDLEDFKETGLRLVVGEQGAGKTITVVYLLLMYKKQYPRLKIRTNMNYKYEDDCIKDWTDLVFKNNGIYGEIDVLDEIQNWFNSLESRDFPVEMFQEITQQRKQKKQILGTSQVWQRVAKPIREQVSILYKPITFFGCLTFVRKYKPCVDSDGSVTSLKYRGCFFFVHSDEIRNAFDTYNKIKTMSLKGFKSATERLAQSVAFPKGCPDCETSSIK